MIYLKSIRLLSLDDEYNLICTKKNIHNNLYPCKIFPEKELEKINFDPITIFYGGNGSGKTTLLNIISSKLNANRKNQNKKGELYDTYIAKMEEFDLNSKNLENIKFISSDDIFDYILDLRAINDEVSRRKEYLVNEYYEHKYKNNYAENAVLGLFERSTNFAVCVAVSVCEVPDSIFPLNTATFYLKRKKSQFGCQNKKVCLTIDYFIVRSDAQRMQHDPFVCSGCVLEPFKDFSLCAGFHFRRNHGWNHNGHNISLLTLPQ